MNNRIRKKREKPIIELCKKITWDNGRSIWNDDINKILLKIVKKCYIDKFHIEEYSLSEIPYADKDGMICYFSNNKDMENYYIKKIKDTKIREIAFWVEYSNELAIPMSVDTEKSCNVEHKKCEDAVFIID